jgi:hypothetical protein
MNPLFLMEDGTMLIFKDVHEMRRWIVQKIGDGWSPGALGVELADIIHEMPNRPPYKTDWTAFFKSLPTDPTELVFEKRHLAKPKKDFIAVVELADKKNKVLGIISERDKNDCFRAIHKMFPDLVTSKATILIKTKSELKADEKKQLENLPRLS